MDFKLQRHLRKFCRDTDVFAVDANLMDNLSVRSGNELCESESRLFQLRERDRKYQPPFPRFFCTIILSAICKRFEEGKSPYTAERISREHKIPIRLTKRILYELQDMQLIYETVNERKEQDVSYIPGVDINQLTVGMLLAKLDANGSEDFKIDRNLYSDSWEALIKAREDFTRKTI